MNSVKHSIRRFIFRHGWDTRNRNLAPALLLRRAFPNLRGEARMPLLDVGCGAQGVAAFLPGVRVVGVDLGMPSATDANITFQIASIKHLPFADRAFPVVTSVDVLEHLSLDDRETAIRELIRVAGRAVLIACPQGETAKNYDEQFRQALETRRRPVPEWVFEHGRQPYPARETTVEQVHAAARMSGRRAEISVSYCEPVAVGSYVRRAAARSDALYTAINLLLGMMPLKLFLSHKQSGSYRMLILTELSG